MEFTLKQDTLSAKLTCELSPAFRKQVNNTTFSNGTGGFMEVFIYEDGLVTTKGGNNSTSLRDNCLYIYDDELIIDFENEIIWGESYTFDS